jgi:ligand-binding sensor domain-containing protein
LGGKLFVGSYGGGIQSISPQGEWIDYSPVIGKFEINSNAMRAARDTLYVGTLDRGFYMYHSKKDRWSQIVEGLPSTNVTAFAFLEDAVLVGTDNGLLRIQEDVLH